ncbi:MAG: hypothetical protein GEV05_08000 [Betaproteobacteria bacterium]|nr:hypothetical protein [Betaproteobacteria bacterium]
MHISTSLSEYYDFANSDMPTFVSRHGAMDRKSYRLAIERWEAEGGAIPGGGHELLGAAVGGRKITRTAPRSKPAAPSSMIAW